MNVDAVRSTALAVAERVSAALVQGAFPLVLGGDCTVELGTVLGWAREREAAPLVYFDAHPDLNTPESVPDGALDWMGVAHLLGILGTRPELTGLGRLAPDALVLFAASPARMTDHERAVVTERRIAAIEQDEVAADPEAAARRALELAGDGPFLLHLDADVIDFGDLPLAENTDRNVGLPFVTVAAALDVLLAGPAVAAMTVTEVNPHHGEADGSTLARFLDRLAPAVARAPRGLA